MAKGKIVTSSVTTVMQVVILVLVAALIVGTLLSQTIFTAMTIINTDELKGNFGGFVEGLIGFLVIIGVIVGIVWLVSYIKTLFDKKQGLGDLSA
jgi:large-conductance mechanosensitive channel